MSKTPEELKAIARERERAINLLDDAMMIMKSTGCSFGADLIRECIVDLRRNHCDEY